MCDRRPSTVVVVGQPASMPWGDFSADPRDPAAASLRASDRDRAVVLGLLAESYADGRLNREEYDERVAVVSSARTLGELPPTVADLVPQTASRGDALARASTEELHERALRAYAASRRDAFSGLLMITGVLSVIWFVVSGDGFYWPIFVVLAAGANLLRVMVHKRDIVEQEQRRLERRQSKSLEPPAGS